MKNENLILYFHGYMYIYVYMHAFVVCPKYNQHELEFSVFGFMHEYRQFQLPIRHTLIRKTTQMWCLTNMDVYK